MADDHDEDKVTGDESVHDDVDFESEHDLGDIGALRAKMTKLKAELASVKTEKQKYLNGWQRCQADSVNLRRDMLAEATRAAASEKIRLIEKILPVLDSFDMAVGSDEWTKVDANWRSGVESIRGQLMASLESFGASTFGVVGDVFDVTMHEALQEIEGEGTSGTIARIVRSGWKTGERIVRPAQVILYV